MAQRPPAPQFGNWEDGENVPYSAYFEKVRKGKNNKATNSNSSVKNSDAYEQRKLPDRASSPKVGGGMHELGAVVSRHDRTDSPTYRASKDKRTAGFPSSSGGAGMTRSEVEVQNKLPHQNMARLNHEHLMNREDDSRQSTKSSNRSPRRSAGTEYGANQPSHRSYNQDSPSWARESLSESSSRSTTPGRSRLRPVAQGHKIPDHEIAVPRFGEWNEKDPSSSDGYTQIFNRVRDEKQHGAATSSAIRAEQDNSSTEVQKAHGNKKPQKCWCFPWLAK